MIAVKFLKTAPFQAKKNIPTSWVLSTTVIKNFHESIVQWFSLAGMK